MADTGLTLPFLASPVPARAVDQAQLAWNAKQWADIQRYVTQLETRLQVLEAFVVDHAPASPAAKAEFRRRFR